MDTLKRYGSLRLSKRKKKGEQDKKYADNDHPNAEPGENLLAEPKFYATLGRKQKSAKVFFTISFKDVVVSTLHGYQPTHLKAIFERHSNTLKGQRQSHSSDQVLWEPSLRCTSTGSGVWHPPFIIHTAVSVPKLSKSTIGDKDSLVLRQKDAYVSIENLDLKGKRKLLAKTRLNLSDYFESAAEKDVSFRLKLHPESSKIESVSIDLTLRKSVKDPRTGPLDVDVPQFSDDQGFSRSPSQKSLDSFPYGSRKNDVSKDNSVVGVDTKTTEIPLPTTPSENSTDLLHHDLPPVVTDTNKPAIVPNVVTPPPLPPRSGASGGQKSMSTDSPPPSSHILKPDITSTPLGVTNTRAKTAAISGSETAASATDRPSSPVVFVCPVAPLAKPEEFKTLNRVITPPEKEIDWSDDDAVAVSSSLGMGINVCGPRPSPKVGKPTEHSKLSNDKDLIKWAEAKLVNVKPYVKVTNLTSSWRNGLGFCLILQKSYPHLIPLQDLSMEHAKDNNEIAFDVADMLDIETDVVREMALQKEKTDKTAIAEFLSQLRLLPTDNLDPPASETVIEFQKKWFRRRKYFKKEVGQLCKKEDEDEAQTKAAAVAAEAAAAAAAAVVAAEAVVAIQKEAVEVNDRVSSDRPSEEEEDVDAPKEDKKFTEPSNLPNDEPIQSNVTEFQEPCSSKREEVRRLIKLEHQKSSSYEDDSVGSDLGSSSASTNGGGRLCESGTILEELTTLAGEEEEISGELEKLELALRNQDVEMTDELEFEAL